MFGYHIQCNPKQISLTGVRAICILALLSQGPKSYEEIRDFLIESNIVNREYSFDTIRIDLKTLRYIGCKISRAKKSTDNKYVLISHPFELEINENDIKALLKTYKYISKSLSIEKLLEYDELFNKIANISISKDDIKERLLGISLLKNIDKKLLRETLKIAEEHPRIIIEYISGGSKIQNFDITIDTLKFRSGKLYIYCFNHTLGDRSFLLFSRFRKIIAKKINNNEDFISKDLVIKFELRNHEEYTLEDSEKKLNVYDNTALIEGAYYTEFIALQRLLYLGPDCKVIEPVNIKQKLITKLKNMRGLYD